MLEIVGDRLICQSCNLNIPYRGKIYRHSCTASRNPGLGTRIERILKAVGITEDRYKELKKIAGFEPTCNCPQRKMLLNKLPKALALGYARGGFRGAWENAVQCAKEVKEYFEKPR